MLATVLCLAALSAAASDKDAWALLIDGSRKAPQKVAFEDVLARARALGLAGAESRKSPQAEYARARLSGSRNGLPLFEPPPGGAIAATGGIVSFEREPNDVRGWADTLVLGRAVEGEVSQPFDADSFAFELAVDGEIDLVTSPGSSGAALVDTILELTDEHGALIAISDDASGLGLYSRIRLPLRAGRYLARVTGYGDETGSWRLSTAVTPQSFGHVTTSTTVGGATTPASNVAAFVLHVADASRVSIAVNGVAGFDPMLWVCSPQGSALAFNDDAVGVNSRVDIDLAPGEYVLYVQGYLGSSGSFNVQTSALVQPLLPGCVGGTAAIASGWNYRTIELTVAGAPLTQSQVVLGSAGAGSAPDTMLSFYDSDWRLIASNDDSVGLHAAVRLQLPPGTYRAIARTFPGSPTGNFAYSGQCATTAAETIVYCNGSLGFSFPTGGSRAMRIVATSHVPVIVRTMGPLDSIVTLLSNDGKVRDWNDDADESFNSLAGVRVGPEGAIALVHGYDGQGGATTTLQDCPLALFGTPGPSASLFQVSAAKAGATILTLRGRPTQPLPLPAISGLLYLDFETMVVASQSIAPQSGFANLSQVLTSQPTLFGAKLAFQHVAYDVDRSDAWLSNVVWIGW